MTGQRFVRPGFTLIDLLVSIALGLILLGLFLPMVLQFREAVACETSIANLRQIAIAIHNHHDALGNFPDFSPEPVGTPAAKTATSVTNKLLAHLEQGALADKTQPNGLKAGAAATVIKVILSPVDLSNPTSVIGTGKTALATTSYAFNPLAFDDKWPGSLAPAKLGQSFPDGTKLTIMITERYQSCKNGETSHNIWSSVAAAEAPATSTDPFAATVTRSVFVAAQVKGLAVNQGPLPQFASKFDGEGMPLCRHGLPQSQHSKSILLAMCDASVRSVSKDVTKGNATPPSGLTITNPEQLNNWTAALTPASGESLGPAW